MTKKEADIISKTAKKHGIFFTTRGKTEDQYSVIFSKHSEFEFYRYTAAITFLLSFAIEKEKL